MRPGLESAVHCTLGHLGVELVIEFPSTGLGARLGLEGGPTNINLAIFIIITFLGMHQFI